jgi:hypothetical protein
MDQATAYENAVKVLWQSLAPAAYNPTFGLEKAWMNNYLDWGFPLEPQEIKVTVGGKEFNGRHFHKVGLVIWDPASGASVVGKPVI